MRLADAKAIVRFLWTATRGYHLRPWASPYLRWRIETYWGSPADTITFQKFWSFTWRRRADLTAFLLWAARMAAGTPTHRQSAPQL